MTITIDSDIQLPGLWSDGAGRPQKYPWLTMKVGDSFFVGGMTISSMCARVSMRRKSSPYRYTCRTVDGGVRVWRIA